MRKKFFSLILISLLLSLFDYFNFDDPIRYPIEPQIVNLKKTIYRGVFQLRYLPKILFHYNDIVNNLSENQNLKNENDKLKLEFQYVTEENQSLRRQLGAPLPSSIKFIPADVIAVSRHMEITAGLTDGVKAGMSVVDGLNLVGRVSLVTSRRSQVQLLSDSDLEIPAITNRGARGEISGQLNEFVLFKKVLQKDPLFLEDTLMTTGEGGFPVKLMIGTVNQIDSDDAQVYKKSQVIPFTDPHELKKVFVIEE